jgi:uncharacterized membrane protein YfcA
VLESLPLDQWLLASLVVGVGAMVQGSVGIGYALCCAPFLRMIGPQMVPVPIMTAAFSLIVLTMLRERQHISLKGAGWVLAGRVPGALAGAWLLGLMPDRWLSVVIGGVVLFAVATIALGWVIPFNAGTQGLAGFASGVTGTTTAIGGPPLAMLYRERKGPELRSTLAAIFLVGLVINLSALGVNGQLRTEEVLIGLSLVPGTVVGFLVSSRVRKHVDGQRLKTAILVVCGAAALSLLARTLW